MEYGKIPQMSSQTTSTLLNWFKQITADSKNRGQTQENTQISDTLLANILENAAEAIILVNQDQNIISFNKYAERVFGYSAEEITGASVERLIPQRFADAHHRHIESFAKDPRPSKMMGERQEIIGLRKDGEEFPAEASIVKLTVDGRHVFSVFLRDITRRKRIEKESRILFQLNQVIAETGSFDTALEKSIRVICENTGWDYGEVWILSKDGKRLELGNPFFMGKPELKDFHKASKSFAFAPHIGMPGRVWESQKAIWVPDIVMNTKSSRCLIAKKMGLNAAVGIPIQAADAVVAVMVFFLSQARRNDAAIIDLVAAAVAQLGTAFQHKQAEGRIEEPYNGLEQSANPIKKRLRESEALAQIAHSLSETERIGLTELLGLIANSARELISGAEQSVIHILDEKEQFLIPKAVAGTTPPSEQKNKMRLGEGVAGQVITSGNTINISDVEKDDRFLRTQAIPQFRSLLVSPVISGERKLGTISVQSKIPNAFTESDASLLSTLGDHAAIALENANLIEEIQQSLKETNALYHINRGLLALNADELLNDVVELIATNFDYYHVQIYVVDPETKNFTLKAASGRTGKKLLETEHSLPHGMGIVGHVAKTLEPFFTNNVKEVDFFVRNRLLSETQAEMAVPIQSGDTLFGIFDIQLKDTNIVTQRNLHLVSIVADQLALALQKAELYEHLQISLQQEKATRSQLVHNERLAVMGRLLASVSHELNNPLQAIQNSIFLLKEDEGISEQGRRDLEIALAESERMANMIKRLRAIYRPIQAEDFTPTQVNHLIEDVHALISTHLHRNEIAFLFQPDPALPYMNALSDQLRQVFLNLFMNAVEAMSRGDMLTVQTKYHSESEEILIIVSDTGTGISPNILAEIFEPFITNKKSGTGLGLTITREIVIKHRGNITAENNPQRGATFKIWLPITSRELE
jgi:PAS domain S-box-containing protein